MAAPTQTPHILVNCAEDGQGSQQTNPWWAAPQHMGSSSESLNVL